MGKSQSIQFKLHQALFKEEYWLKGEVSREFDVISKRKNVCLSTETKKSSVFVINYIEQYRGFIKLSPQCNETVD